MVILCSLERVKIVTRFRGLARLELVVRIAVLVKAPWARTTRT